MSDEPVDMTGVVDMAYWREARRREEDDVGGGSGGGLPPIGPPGGDGSTPQPTFGSEDMLSEELSAELGEDWICAQPLGAWHRWDGLRWNRRDGDFLVRQKVQLVARRVAHPVGLKTLARQICRMATMRGAVSMASTNERHGRNEHRLDVLAEHELNTPAGLVNLKTGFIGPHDRDRLLTRIAGAGPEPMALCPRWRRYIDEATGGDKSLADYLQRLAGYLLTGAVDEHKIFFLFGKSRTGKTVFLTVLHALLGDYAITASVDMFLMAEGQRHLTEVMDLNGPRLVIAGETPAGRRWNDSLLKQISGGDKLRANRMRQDPIEFQPQCKLLLAGNHRPRLRSGDDAMRERFIVIPFQTRQPVLDETLTDQLKRELPGIFNWALEGEMIRQKGARLGRVIPLAVREATDEYFRTENLLKSWIEDACQLGADYTALTAELYKSFTRWCEAAGERYPPPMNKFSEELMKLDDLGIKTWRKAHDGKRGFAGLRLARATGELDL